MQFKDLLRGENKWIKDWLWFSNNHAKSSLPKSQNNHSSSYEDIVHEVVDRQKRKDNLVIIGMPDQESRSYNADQEL